MLVHRWGEARGREGPAVSSVVTPWHAREEAVSEAEKLVRSRFAAWNRADSRGLRAALHLPHVSLPGSRLSIRQSEPELLHSPDFRSLASIHGWHASALDGLDVYQAWPDKVHCVVTFGRSAADGTRYADGRAVYLVTYRDGRWGIQLSSVTLRPIGVGGADDGEAVAAASSVLRRWLTARDGQDRLAVRRLVHLPFVELDGARLLVRRSVTALRAVPGRGDSAVGSVRVRERSAHKVTMEADIVRYEPGGALVASDPALVIVTQLQGRWGLQVYSSFLTSPREMEQR
jgi:hypothetical protein